MALGGSKSEEPLALAKMVTRSPKNTVDRVNHVAGADIDQDQSGDKGGAHNFSFDASVGMTTHQSLVFLL